MFVVQESFLRNTLKEKQCFYAVPVTIPDEVAQRILLIQREAVEIADYLSMIKIGQNVEVPECVRELVTPAAVKDEPPKKKAIAPTSRKKSRKSSKKTDASSSTSQSKDE